MKLAKAAAVLIPLVVSASCNNDLSYNVSQAGRVSIYASVENTQSHTRSAIDPTVYKDGAVGILWTPDDKIGVFSETTKNSPFSNSLQTSAGRTEFSGELVGEPLYTYYPYSDDNNGLSPEELKGTIPLEQPYDSRTGVISGDYKCGALRQGAEDEFDFVHLFSLLKIRINAQGTNVAGENLKSISITVPGRTIAGEFKFNAITRAYNFTGSLNSETVTSSWTETPSLDDQSYYSYCSIAPEVRSGDPIKIAISTNKHIVSFNAEATTDFEPNAVYDFEIDLDKFNDGNHGWKEEEIKEESEETANCYMITEAGEHSFKATVIGNGEKGIIKGVGFHTENPYIDPKSAKLLWEDTKGFISNVELRDGRVYYTTAGNVGNAVIAVYDAAAGGNILWSWHIWGVGDTLPEDVEYTNMAGAKFIVMDRNLGSRIGSGARTMADSISSMLYQWGRKDPIPNADVYYRNNQAIDIETYPMMGETFSTMAETLAASIRNPDKMMKLTSNTHWLPVNDLKDEYFTFNDKSHTGTNDDYLWGHTNFCGPYQFAWGTNLKDPNAGAGWTDVKTIYDPSPVGYRVANQFTWTGFLKSNHNLGNFSFSGYMNVSGNPCLKDEVNFLTEVFTSGNVQRLRPKYSHGYFFMANLSDKKGQYYPHTGMRHYDGTRSGYGTTCYVVSSAPQSNKYYCQLLYVGEYTWLDKVVVGGGAGNQGSINTVESSGRVNARAVRCVKE